MTVHKYFRIFLVWRNWLPKQKKLFKFPANRVYLSSDFPICHVFKMYKYMHIMTFQKSNDSWLISLNIAKLDY